VETRKLRKKNNQSPGGDLKSKRPEWQLDCARISKRFISVLKPSTVTEAMNVLPMEPMFFRRGIMLRGRSDVSPVATTPWRLQVRTVFGGQRACNFVIVTELLGNFSTLQETKRELLLPFVMGKARNGKPRRLSYDLWHWTTNLFEYQRYQTSEQKPAILTEVHDFPPHLQTIYGAAP
jgi:hypothetical protein